MIRHLKMKHLFRFVLCVFIGSLYVAPLQGDSVSSVKIKKDTTEATNDCTFSNPLGREVPGPDGRTFDIVSFADSSGRSMDSISINERKIYTLFTPHLSSDLQNRVYYLTDIYEKDYIGTIQFINNLKTLLWNNKDFIKGEYLETAEIIDLVEMKTINWIGVEASQEEIHMLPSVDEILKTKNFFEKFETNLYSNYLFDIAEWRTHHTHDILYLLFPSYLIAQTQHRKPFKIIPLEDSELKKKQLEWLNKHRSVASNLQDLTSQFKYDQIDELVTRLNYLFSSTNFEEVSQQQLDDLLKNYPHLNEQIVRTIHQLLPIHNQLVFWANRRDEFVADMAFHMKGNGLILMGGSHGRGVKRILAEKCRKAIRQQSEISYNSQ